MLAVVLFSVVAACIFVALTAYFLALCQRFLGVETHA